MADAPPPRLLAIDDEPTMCQIFSRALRAIAHVTTASTVAEAEALLGRETFDAIICDVNMPAGGGPAVRAHIQRLQPALLDRTLYVTGGVTTDDKIAFVESIRDRLLEKPFTMIELQAAVRALTHRPSA
ncbi:MAG: response regulator [Myxococcales bacterium]|nr:response regulator [Myxococcales bacterium]